MSAIFGIYYLDGRKADTTDLKRMSERLAHRGSDGTGFWNEGSVGFGHRMLWVTPESLHEKLPFFYSSNGTQVTITAEARLDNRDELIKAFDLSSRSHELITDSELIVRAYQEWEEACPEKLLGDFAFVIWDHRQQKLFCARDPFGIKPFFYFYLPNRIFVFASEIKALFCVPGIPQKLNETMVADFLAQIYEDKWITFYRNILRLPPAHRLRVEGGKLSTEQYWSLDPSREIKIGSDEEYEETFRHLFTEAVHARLRCAFPAGLMLSGGLDSSSIACIARMKLSQSSQSPLHTFSFVFDEVPECDERPYIDAVLAQGGFKPHYIHGDRLSPLVDLERIQWLGDEPYSGPTFATAWASYKEAKEQKVRMILNGIGGDEAVWYNLTFLTEFARAGKWREINTELNDYSRLRGTSFRKKIKILWLRCLKPFVPEIPRRVWRQIHGRGEQLFFADTLIRPEFARRMNLEERSKVLHSPWYRNFSSLREEQYFYLTTHLKTTAIETYDRATALFSCEHRYPFFDKRLLEFCLALPPEQKFRQGYNRRIVRQALQDALPVKIRERITKMDASPNIFRGLLFFEQERLENMILKDPGIIEDYVNISALRSAYQRYSSHRTFGEVREEDFYDIWNAVTLALWLRSTDLKP